jgi:hypothetical protein
MVRIITFGNKKVWLFIEQLHTYNNGYEDNLLDNEDYICYFKFSEPTLIIYGELIRETSSKQPMMFGSIEKAEEYASGYLQKRFNLN